MFELGQVVVTSNALGKLNELDILNAIIRHKTGDWGNLCEEDKKLNEDALKSGKDRLMSAYKSQSGIKFWVITEWDKSVTTILLPEDY